VAASAPRLQNTSVLCSLSFFIFFFSSSGVKSATCYLRGVRDTANSHVIGNSKFILQPANPMPCAGPGRVGIFGSCHCRSDRRKKERKKQREILPESIGQLNRFFAPGGGEWSRPAEIGFGGWDRLSIGRGHISAAQAFFLVFVFSVPRRMARV